MAGEGDEGWVGGVGVVGGVGGEGDQAEHDPTGLLTMFLAVHFQCHESYEADSAC